MANPIEHRSIETLLQFYSDNNEPNISIWNGKRFCIKCDEDNNEAAMATLINYCNQISSVATAAVYELRTHKSGTKNINKHDAPYELSTTFMLTPFTAQQATTQPTLTNYIAAGTKPAAIAPVDTKELQELKEENKNLVNMLHKQELQRMEDKFTAMISGITAQPEPKNLFDKFMEVLDKITEKPEVLDKVSGAIGRIFHGDKNYIIDKQAVQVSGTSNTAEPMTETTTKAAPMINEILTEEERKLKPKDQAPIMIAKLTPLTDDQHQDVQNDCLASIEARIGNVTLTRMLIAVACLDDDDMNKLLRNLE